MDARWEWVRPWMYRGVLSPATSADQACVACAATPAEWSLRPFRWGTPALAASADSLDWVEEMMAFEDRIGISSVATSEPADGSEPPAAVCASCVTAHRVLMRWTEA